MLKRAKTGNENSKVHGNHGNHSKGTGSLAKLYMKKWNGADGKIRN
jgi:hypothetical protein